MNDKANCDFFDLFLFILISHYRRKHPFAGKGLKSHTGSIISLQTLSDIFSCNTVSLFYSFIILCIWVGYDDIYLVLQYFTQYAYGTLCENFFNCMENTIF